MADCSISIIIPAYNVEKYLKAALDSIKGQTELPDEVILIDDGSTDGTLDVANAFEFPVPYQVVSIENGGQGSARNLGVSLASSEYVYFFDSDDLLTSNFIQSIKTRLHQNQHPDIVLFSGQSFNDDEYQGSRRVNYCRGFSGVFNDRSNFLDKAHSHNALFCSPCLYVSKKSLWGRTRLNFSSNYFEDEAVFLPLIFTCSSFLVIDQVFFLRRNRENSTMTMQVGFRHVEGTKDCMNSTLRLLRDEKGSRREIWHIRNRLKRQSFSYINAARDANAKINFAYILGVVKVVKSLELALRLGVYSLGLDTPLRKMIKRLRVFGA